MSPAILVGIGVVALAAFATEGAIGFGGTVIAACIGAQLIPLDVLLPAFVVLNLALSSWLLGNGIRAVAWRTLAVQVAPAVAVGAAIGLALFHVPAKSLFALVFGVFVVALATLELARPADHPLGGVIRIVLLVLGGVAHGLFGTGGPLIVYVVRRQLPDKRAFRATLAVLWLTLNTALLLNFASAGLYDRSVATVGGVLALAIVPGLVIGERLHRRLDPMRFERVVWILLLVAGTALAVRSAFNLA